MAAASKISMRLRRLPWRCRFSLRMPWSRNFRISRAPPQGGWALGMALPIETERHRGKGFGFREESAHGSTRIKNRVTFWPNFKAFCAVCPAIFRRGAAMGCDQMWRLMNKLRFRMADRRHSCRAFRPKELFCATPDEFRRVPETALLSVLGATFNHVHDNWAMGSSPFRRPGRPKDRPIIAWRASKGFFWG